MIRCANAEGNFRIRRHCKASGIDFAKTAFIVSSSLPAVWRASRYLWDLRLCPELRPNAQEINVLLLIGRLWPITVSMIFEMWTNNAISIVEVSHNSSHEKQRIG